MKVAILSESSADEAALRVLVGGLLGQKAEPVAYFPLRARGSASVLKMTPGVLAFLHYRSDAEAFVVSVDSDDTVVHLPAHEEPGGSDQKCRLCALRAKIDALQRSLRPRQGGEPIRTAVGLAVPAIEAWCLAMNENRVNETQWLLGQQSGQPPYTRTWLKQKLYGTDRPPLSMETQVLIRAAQEVVDKDHLPDLEKLFPGGFGALARQIRAW